MSNIKVDYDILNQKQTPAFYASSLATRPAFGFPGRIFIDTDTPSSGIYRDTGSAWVQVADPGAGTTGTLQQVTTNGNTTTLGIQVQGIDINDGAGTGTANSVFGIGSLQSNTTGANNTAIGYTTMQANTTGTNNTAVGVGSLNLNTTGSNNTANGKNALLNNTTGDNNTAVGYESLKNTTTAGGNTAIGYLSSTTNTTGVNNSSLGISSLRLNTTGANNTAIGSIALQNNTTGSFNTAVGYASLTANTTGANNTAIGIESLIANTTGVQNVAIGNQSLGTNTTGLQNVAIGVSTLLSNTTGFGNVSIGYASMTLNTTGELNIGIGGTALTNNTTGVRNTAIGIAAGSLITTGSYNTLIGAYAGTSTLTSNIVLSDGLGNVRLFSNDTGKVGINVPITDTPTGQVDIHTSLTNALVLNGNTTNNAYLGLASAGVNKWRIGNTYNAGANSFDIYNIGTSTTALSFNSTTNAATFSSSVTATQIISNYAGKDGLIVSDTRTQAAGVGGSILFKGVYTNSGSPLDFGRISLMKENSTNADYSFGMGFYTSANGGSNPSTNPNMYIAGSGNVGIGTSSPQAKLQVFGTDSQAFTTSNTGIFTVNSSSTVQLNIGGINTSSYAMWLQTRDTSGGTNAYPISLNPAGGSILLGTYTDDTINKLQVTGSGKFTSILSATSLRSSATGSFGFNTANNGEFQIYGTDADGILIAGRGSNNDLILLNKNGGDVLKVATGTITITLQSLVGTGSRAVIADASGNLSAPVSDISVKENISTIGYGLNEVLKMNPVWFNFIDEYKNYGESRQNGNIAQEMEAIIPEAVFTTPTTGKMGINYDQLHAVYIKAIQELKAEIDALKNN